MHIFKVKKKSQTMINKNIIFIQFIVCGMP